VYYANPDPGFHKILVGISLVFLGEGIRVWAAGHLQKNEVLTVTGPYAYVKNPLYIGSIFITTGFCIMADNIYLLAAAFFMFCFHYIPYKKKMEGDRLKRHFGNQYEDYDEKVPEYLPRMKALFGPKGLLAGEALYRKQRGRNSPDRPCRNLSRSESPLLDACLLIFPLPLPGETAP